MIDCLGNEVKNFIPACDLKKDELQKYLNEKVFSQIRATNLKAIRVYRGEEDLKILDHEGKVVSTRRVKRFIGWNIAVV